MNRRRRLLAGLAAMLIAGCAATDSAVKNARGQGFKRTYRQPYDRVYAALLAVIAERKLTIVEQDPAQGLLVLHSPGTVASERIGVFLTANNERSTTVEVVAKAVVSSTLAPDWAARLHGDLEQALAPRRPVQ
jgi:hypothetical protein